MPRRAAPHPRSGPEKKPETGLPPDPYAVKKPLAVQDPPLKSRTAPSENIQEPARPSKKPAPLQRIYPTQRQPERKKTTAVIFVNSAQVQAKNQTQAPRSMGGCSPAIKRGGGQDQPERQRQIQKRQRCMREDRRTPGIKPKHAQPLPRHPSIGAFQGRSGRPAKVTRTNRLNGEGEFDGARAGYCGAQN